jgi:sensor histidine kinase regulating citrate/malate metabolism
MRWKMSLARQFLLLQLCIVLLAVSAVAAVSIAQSDSRFRNEEGRRLRSLATSLGSNAPIRLGLEDPARWRDALAVEAESARGVSGVSFVQIVDDGGHVLTGPDTGRPVMLGESDALTGRSWVGVINDGTEALVAHEPVFNEDNGEIVGLVVVGRTYPTLREQLAAATPDLLTYLLLGATLGVAGSLLLSRRIKRQTLGLEPGEITGLVEHREAMLHGIKEGVIGVDTADRITLVNDEAVRLLGLPADAVGRSLAALELGDHLREVLTGKVTGPDQVVVRDDKVLVLNQMPVVVRGRLAGSVTTLRDRTELAVLRRELDVSRHTTDTLRAQAHEFTNKLHTVAGLVELGEYNEVIRYITLASQAHEQLICEVTSRIADPALGALLIAKASLAAEQNVELRIAPGSVMEPLDETLAADLVTVVGNLVDNALDALSPGGWVEVGARTSNGEITVTVRDSGEGVAPDMIDEVFTLGFTTKSGDGHRGLGLAMARLLCARRGGSIDVQGSVFTVRLPLAIGSTA